MPESQTPAPGGALAQRQPGMLGPQAPVATRIRAPRPHPIDGDSATIGLKDILYALFKHKKTIIMGTALGLLVMGGVYFFFPAQYESNAKLLVRYLVERSSVDSVDRPQSPGGYAPTTDGVIGSEVEILNSWDLAVQTAEAIGPKRILPRSKGTPTKEAAASVIASGLELTTHKGSNIIFVSYKNRDPEITTVVLNELVNRYFNKHLEVHRSAGAFDFVTQQTDQERGRLSQTEDALKDLKAKAGIVSLTDSTTALSSEGEKVEAQLQLAEADLAEQQALVRQLNGSVGSITINAGDDPKPRNATPDNSPTTQTDAANKAEAAPTAPPIPTEVVQKYQVLASGLQKLRQTQLELFAKYTPESQMVKANQGEIDDVDHQLRGLEKRYPTLPTVAGPIGSSKSKELDPAAETARLAGLRAKRNALAGRLQSIRERIQQLSQIEPQIVDLERQKQLEEANYKYFEATLQKARIDEALDPSKIPNISAVQRPSPPGPVTAIRNKVMLAAAFGGFALALGFVFLKEIVLGRTIRRAVEIERFLGINPLMEIPYNPKAAAAAAGVNGNGQKKNASPKPGSRPLAPWDQGHFIRRYAEAIRDRLGLYFELHNLTHKPKLVGVSAFAGEAGASTLAAGLAAALSETNDGKVLLVDVSLGPDQVHPFFRGKPAYALNTALVANGTEEMMDPAAENLYLAKVASQTAGPAQLGLKKFFDLMPNMKASDFDYIIFDMPPLDDTSPTWGMAPFMDKMLLVIEAEKSDRDAVKRNYRKLTVERDNLSLIFNKVRSYGPKRLALQH